nr:ATP synthase F0 subunit 6 [Chamelea striatula]
MMSDLFSSFDYAWGGGAYIFGISIWISSILLPIFLFFFMSYWYSPNYLEAMLMSVIEEFSIILSPLKGTSGITHVLSSLLITLMVMNVGGVFPYSYPLMSHFVASASFAFPFWFVTLALNFNPNFRLFMLAGIRQGGVLFPTGMAMVSEFVSMFARPLTLTCRLSMNIIVGQLVLKLVSCMCVGMLFPFGLSGVTPVIMNLGWFILSTLFFVMEVCVAILQSCIFVGLLVFYLREAPLVF